MPLWWPYPVIAAFLISLVLSDVLRTVGVRFGFVDAPTKERKKHDHPIPTLGGGAIYVSFAIVTIVILQVSDHFTSGDITSWHFVGLLGGGLILILGGLLDDKFDLPPRVTFLFPMLAALVAVLGGIGVSKITNPLGGALELAPIVSDLFAFAWLIGMMYTTKLLDGLDGLSGGITAIGALMIGLLALSTTYFQPDVALLALIAVASILGFLVWNFPPASLYLGEGGSTFVGYLLGSLAIISGGKVATALLVVGVPAFDIFFVMAERWRTKRSLFIGDRSHLHHRLYDLGLTPRTVIAIYYGIAIVFGLTTLIFASWQKLAVLGGLFFLLLLTVSYLAHRKSYV